MKQVPVEFLRTCRRLGVLPSRYVLGVSIALQTMELFRRVQAPRKDALGCLSSPESKWFTPSSSPLSSFPSLFPFSTSCASPNLARWSKTKTEQLDGTGSAFPSYEWLRTCRISTSRFGVGQKAGSNKTPLGLHRIAGKIGGGHPLGTVFESRKPVGLTWQGRPSAAIAHRILWLEGLEPGLNRGSGVDSYSRCIYLHGVGDETTLGRPASKGCIHLAASDLLRLFDLLPGGTLVWISQG